MTVKIKVCSLDQLISKCYAAYIVYSPSRGKAFHFGEARAHCNVSTSNYQSSHQCGNYGYGIFHTPKDAELKKGIAINEGWSDAVVKMVYWGPSYYATARTDTTMVSIPWKLDGSSLIPDVQGFAEWLISNNYAELVNMVGDMSS